MGKNIKIWTSYYAGLKNLPADVVPVSIAGQAPAGWTGLEYKKAAPRLWFFKAWKERRQELGDTWYTDRYTEEVLGALDPVETLKELIKLTGGAKKIALVCYEKPLDFCHRHLFYGWLRNNFLGTEGLEFPGEYSKEEGT